MAPRKPVEGFTFEVGDDLTMSVTGTSSGEVLTFVGVREGFTYKGTLLREPDGTLRVTRVIVDAPGGVKAAMLRSIPIGSITRLALVEVRAWADHLGDAGGVVAELSAELRDEASPRGGRPPIGDDFLLELAQDYLDRQSTLGGGGVIPELARRRGDLPIGTVRDWVRRAADAGFLSPAQQGQRQGRGPGPKFTPRSKETR